MSQQELISEGALWIEGEEASDMVLDAYTALYRAKIITHSADGISYTEDFEILYARVSRHYPVTRHEVFSMLMTHRKAGRLPGPRKDKEAPAP